MAVATALWSLELEPGKQYPILVRRDIQITSASFSDELADASEAATNRSTVKVTHAPVNERDFDDESDYDSEDLSDEDGEEDDEDSQGEEEEEEKEKAQGGKAKKSNGDISMQSTDGAEDDDEEDDDEDDDFEDEEEPVAACLCTLIPGKIENVQLNLRLVEEDIVMFEVTGKNTVHLMGNYIDQTPFEHDRDDYDDMEDSELDSDEEGMYDEDDDDLVSLTSSQEADMERMFGSGGVESAKGRIEEISEEAEGSSKRSTKSAQAGEKRKAESTDAAKDSEAADASSKNQQKKLAKKLKAESGEAVKADVKEPAAKKEKTTEAAAAKKEKPKKESAKSNKRTTGSGLVIEDIKVGDGPLAKSGKKCQMRYIGKLTNGKQFDANTSGAPFSFALGRGEVIKGWDEGVQGMKVGGERRLTVPAKLAYGSQKLPGIPANSTLVFDIKLVGVRG